MHNQTDAQKTATATATAPATAAVQPGEKPFSPDHCWFCTKAEAKKPEFHFKVPMYRQGKLIGTEKNAKGKTVEKYEWNTVKFPVPRCQDCEETHNLRHWANSGPTLLVMVIFGAAMAWQLKDYHADMDMVPLMETTAYGVCALFFALSFSRYLLSRMDAATPGELHARNYPVLDKLISDGWIIGEHKASGDEGTAVSKSSRV